MLNGREGVIVGVDITDSKEQVPAAVREIAEQQVTAVDMAAYEKANGPLCMLFVYPGADGRVAVDKVAHKTEDVIEDAEVKKDSEGKAKAGHFRLHPLWRRKGGPATQKLVFHQPYAIQFEAEWNEDDVCEVCGCDEPLAWDDSRPSCGCVYLSIGVLERYAKYSQPANAFDAVRERER